MRESAASGPIRIFFLRNLSSSGAGTAKYQAQNILCFFYGECDWYYLETGETRAPEKSNSVTEQRVQPEFKIYPNPAGNWVMIEFTQQAYDLLENAEIIITDVSGNLIHQTNLTRTTYLWETGSVENGVYLIMVRSDNVVFSTEKVIINR